MSGVQEIALLGDPGLCRKRWSRFTISLDGHICSLREKSFKYLFALAVARHLRDDGWVDKRDVEPGRNQTKYFYQLRQELKAACGGAQRLIKNNGRGSYRLALPKENIQFNWDVLSGFPDFEIQEALKRLLESKGAL